MSIVQPFLIPATDEIADALGRAEACAEPIDPIGRHLADAEAAYAVQDRNTARRIETGGRLIGRKIGLTAKPVQDQLGVNAPDYGALFDDMQIGDGGVVDVSRLIKPRIEAEIAFKMARAVTETSLAAEALLAHIESAHAALEVVDSRILDWKITLADTIADNASSARFVTNETGVRPETLDLRRLGMALARNDEIVSTGAGAACLGSPLNALSWLADKMIDLGQPLQVGDIVLSGALGPVVDVDPGDRFEARVAGLGSVSVSFSA